MKIQFTPDDAGVILKKKGLVPYARGESAYLFAHRGTSMKPTLCELDLLEIVPYGERPVRAGDVIFYLPPHGDNHIVHRAVCVNSEGIHTRGDNNSRRDPWLIRPEDVIGQVLRAQRGKKKRAIYGGAIGRLWSSAVKFLKAVDRCISLMMHPLYHYLACTGCIRRWFPFTIRIIATSRSNERELKLILGHLIIGRYLPEVAQWQIRRPFRLFVDEKSLPR